MYVTTDCYLHVPYQEVQDGAAKIVAIAWSHNNMKLAVCTADRGKGIEQALATREGRRGLSSDILSNNVNCGTLHFPPGQ